MRRSDEKNNLFFKGNLLYICLLLSVIHYIKNNVVNNIIKNDNNIDNKISIAAEQLENIKNLNDEIENSLFGNYLLNIDKPMRDEKLEEFDSNEDDETKYKNDERKLWQNYSIYSHDNWEDFVFENSYLDKKNNTNLVNDFFFESIFEKNHLILYFNTTKNHNENNSNKDNITTLRYIKTYSPNINLKSQNNVLFYERFIFKFVENTLNKLKLKINENTDKFVNKEFIANVTVEIYEHLKNKKKKLIFSRNLRIYLHEIQTPNKNKVLKIKDFIKSSKEFNNQIQYFKFKESIKKTQIILKTDLSNDLYSRFKSHHLLNENFEYENGKLSKNLKINSKLKKEWNALSNPCFLKGYFNNKTKISGDGNYEECYKQIVSTLGNKFSDDEDFSKNKTSVLLGSDFKDIADLMAKENTTIKEFQIQAEIICSKEYNETKKKYFYVSNIDNICFKVTYALVIFKKLFRGNQNIILIFSTNIRNISPEAENEIIMSNYFTFQVEDIPSWILILFFFMICFFFANYFFKEKLITLMKKKIYKNELILLCLEEFSENKKPNVENFNFNRVNNNVRNSIIHRNSKLNFTNNFDNLNNKEDLENQHKIKIISIFSEYKKDFNKIANQSFNSFSMFHENNNRNQSFFNEEKLNLLINFTNNEEKLDILDTTINSLPVKNFLYTVLQKKIKDFCEREIFLSFSEFKLFFYSEIENEIRLKVVILETIEKRNELKSNKVFCLTQIILAIILSILTNKIFSYITFQNNYLQGIIIVVFSFLYMTLLIMECLVLITLIDYEKYYYSNILTQSERNFLEQEFSIEPNHNYELF